MRRFVVFAALMGLTACGGIESRSEESQVSEASACSGTWECACAKNKTQAVCNASTARCVWVVNKCEPTYE